MYRYARIKHDFQLARYENQSRTLRKGWKGRPSTPETVPLNQQPRAGKGRKIQMTDEMWAYIRSLNTPQSYKTLIIPATGWINNGKNPECLTFGGNAVLVHSEIGRFAHIISLGAPVKTFNYGSAPHLVHKLTTITNRNKIIKIGKGLDVFIALFGDELYIENEFLEYFPLLPAPVYPRLIGGLKEHIQPDVNAKSDRAYAYGDPIAVLDYVLHGPEVWGQTETGFVCLYYPKYKELPPFFSPQTTNWRMETTPPPL